MTAAVGGPLSDECRDDIAVEVYKHLDSRPQPWGWRAVNCRNGNTVADGAELYARRAPMIKRVMRYFGNVEIRFVDPPAPKKGRARR